MPRVTLTFSLPEEQAELNTALNAPAIASLVDVIDQECRIVQKYSESPSEDLLTFIKHIRNMIAEENILR